MKRQTLGLAALRGHDVNIRVAGILRAERDPLAVRREMRIRRLALKAGESPRCAAFELEHAARLTQCAEDRGAGLVRAAGDAPARIVGGPAVLRRSGERRGTRGFADPPLDGGAFS